MRSIDIRTTQNVTITYELAAASDRIIAFLIDTLAKFLVAFLALWVYSLMPGKIGSELDLFFGYLFYVPLIMGSLLVMETTMNGQTLGKKLVRIKVIKLDGRQPAFYDYLLRWCFRIIDVYGTLGITAAIMTASTDYAQRLGDMVSNTTVVRVSNRLSISLQDVLGIEDRLRYTPMYPEVRNFRESDILLIKGAIDRYLKFSNAAHQSALKELAAKMKERLNITEDTGDTIGFLRTLIKDYIVLTR